jgi:hypothetical protein
MSHFSSKLIVSQVSDGIWMVERSFRFFMGEDIDNFVTVPKGFITDFASVPRILWPILPPSGQYAQAACVHDKLYQTHERSRAECDKIFFEGMKVLKVEKWKMVIMYWSVRLFGLTAWNYYTKYI